MKKTSLSHLRSELLNTGAYLTAPENLSVVRKQPSWWLTLRFTMSVIRVFPLCAIVEAFHKLTTELWAKFCFSAVQMPESCGMKVELIGWQNRNEYKGPVVYLCNHLSTLETLFLPPILLSYDKVAIVAKASISHLPCLTRAFEKMGLIALGRKNPKADLLQLYEDGINRLKAGRSVLIFPQGTRSEVFSQKNFSSIGAKLAEKAGVPVVPICIDSRCMPTRKTGFLKKFFKDFGPVDTSRDVRCECGPVLANKPARELHDLSFNWMANKLEAWGLPVERTKLGGN